MAEILLTAVINKSVEIAGNLLFEEGTRLYWLKEDIDWLQREMRHIRSYIDDAKDKAIGGNSRVKNLIKDIQDLAGLGKTTLAKKLYRHVRHQFECSGLVYVSQQPRAGEILHDIAKQVGLTEEERKENLENNLRSLLKIKRYVILLDDIWDVEIWDDLKLVLLNRERAKTSSIALTAEYTVHACDVEKQVPNLSSKLTISCIVPSFVLWIVTSCQLELSSQVVDRKDATRSAFDIWKEILQKRKVKQTKKSFNCFSSVSNDFETLHSLISHRGDYDLIFDGIHENILHLHYTDPVMQKTVQCSDILGYSDIFHQYNAHSTSLSFKSPLAMSIHGLVAQTGKPNIEWPKSFQRYRTMSIEKKEILHSWKNKIPPSISRHLSTKCFVEDLISPFLHILSPSTLKPVALHLLSEKEKADLAQLVNTMVSYATTYKNIKSDPYLVMHHGASDASMLSLDPPIGEFINFKGYISSHIVLASAVKVFLVHEAERQKILQGSSNLHSPPTGAESQDVLRCENSSTMSKASVSSDKTIHFRDPSRQKQYDLPSASSQNKRSAGGTTASGKVGLPERKKKPFVDSRSFFDRFRKPSDKTPQDNDHAKLKQKLEERDSRPLLFKFNEGYTNAVKRPNGVKDLVFGAYSFPLYHMPIFKILAVKSLRELVLNECDLMHHVSLSSGVTKCKSLRNHSLNGVNLDENMLQTLLNSCPLIVTFNFKYCSGLEKIELLNLRKIKSVSIRTHRQINQLVKIQAPTLEHLSYTGLSKELEVVECQSLKSLDLSYVTMSDGFLHSLISRFQSLEAM
ncbi:hypothetical protein H5410_049022 [Solanum commersonii]|uniref:NB-ARC domain-containing protein n=1 Tax=Solanum commersonii TaxID=4109 RepID=A0A9J5XMN7_SOLCO|nr:hypothetical protein H5410_049022 [Solanum commersonii]